MFLEKTTYIILEKRRVVENNYFQQHGFILKYATKRYLLLQNMKPNLHKF